MSYQELYAATAGFSVVLGQGAYGSVYEGVMRDGGAVAVKWLHKPKEAGFEKEVRVLSKFRYVLRHQRRYRFIFSRLLKTTDSFVQVPSVATTYPERHFLTPLRDLRPAGSHVAVTSRNLGRARVSGALKRSLKMP